MHKNDEENGLISPNVENDEGQNSESKGEKKRTSNL